MRCSENVFFTIDQNESPGADIGIPFDRNTDGVARNAFDVRLPMLLIERVHWEWSDNRPCMGAQAKGG
jgi:hypothetical protein